MEGTLPHPIEISPCGRLVLGEFGETTLWISQGPQRAYPLLNLLPTNPAYRLLVGLLSCVSRAFSGALAPLRQRLSLLREIRTKELAGQDFPGWCRNQLADRTSMTQPELMRLGETSPSRYAPEELTLVLKAFREIGGNYPDAESEEHAYAYFEHSLAVFDAFIAKASPQLVRDVEIFMAYFGYLADDA